MDVGFESILMENSFLYWRCVYLGVCIELKIFFRLVFLVIFVYIVNSGMSIFVWIFVGYIGCKEFVVVFIGNSCFSFVYGFMVCWVYVWSCWGYGDIIKLLVVIVFF